ncbi:hypothetical protein SDC9_113919 [bioreactor metagenome]|uniref:Uncharacterized protein n=1 Tax=bioreactor metagenome TaxID=1076179 RepID=A0A645BZ67_9ZZZZ
MQHHLLHVQAHAAFAVAELTAHAGIGLGLQAQGGQVQPIAEARADDHERSHPAQAVTGGAPAKEDGSQQEEAGDECVHNVAGGICHRKAVLGHVGHIQGMDAAGLDKGEHNGG